MRTFTSGAEALLAPPAGDQDDDLRVRIAAEYREMPELKLTLAQAARLFSLDPVRCERVLDALVRRGVLTTDGRTFARRDAGRRLV